MFSGIVEEMGAIQAIDRGFAGAKVSILATRIMEDAHIGDSISVSGTCLTITEQAESGFVIDVSTETLNCTTLGAASIGMPVNLERAVRLNARMGGHLVTGHVDGIGTLRTRESQGNAILMQFEAPENVMRYCVPKGSITVDGISLTINAVKPHSFEVAIIPHTATVTTLGLKQVGDVVNLESDLIGKYVERLLQANGAVPAKSAPVIDQDYLRKHGLI
ncbi:MAG: riboflavin synthase [Nitrospira sp.]|nr:riboflavin synthase [Nitrospira sp.]MCB9712122.1 riboflavin synthase [Nitrospiraceae bacterium]MDR4489114.1 riboflavin synthase [Nitrospirales bacterium]MCA9468600.1 riboflavin synthase [Nitrospira sp.]MCA9475565.1 riboflavin synthase [Nitrospira sp.]